MIRNHIDILVENVWTSTIWNSQKIEDKLFVNHIVILFDIWNLTLIYINKRTNDFIEWFYEWIYLYK